MYNTREFCAVKVRLTMEIKNTLKSKYLAAKAKYGWKLLVVIFFYYLIRDLFLYVAIPYYAVTSQFFKF